MSDKESRTKIPNGVGRVVNAATGELKLLDIENSIKKSIKQQYMICDALDRITDKIGEFERRVKKLNNGKGEGYECI